MQTVYFLDVMYANRLFFIRRVEVFTDVALVLAVVALPVGWSWRAMYLRRSLIVSS